MRETLEKAGVESFRVKIEATYTTILLELDCGSEVWVERRDVMRETSWIMLSMSIDYHDVEGDGETRHAPMTQSLRGESALLLCERPQNVTGYDAPFDASTSS
jgi:hypothetical protein